MNTNRLVGQAVVVGGVEIVGYVIYRHFHMLKIKEQEITFDDIDAEKRDKQIEEYAKEDAEASLRYVKHDEEVTQVLFDAMQESKKEIDTNIQKNIEKQAGRKKLREYTSVKELLIEKEEDDEDNDNEEGGPKLKKGIHPDSPEAMTSYYNVLLADFVGSDTYNILRDLFIISFEPRPGDEVILLTNLYADRESFFGEDSRWTKEAVSWAEVIIKYISRISYNIGDEYIEWAEHIFDQLGLEVDMHQEEIIDILYPVLNHEFTNPDTGLFGLFGLDDAGANYMVYAASKDSSARYTFDMEYNAFLNMSLEGMEDE